MKHMGRVLLLISGMIIAIGGGWYVAGWSFRQTATDAFTHTDTATVTPAATVASASSSHFEPALLPAAPQPSDTVSVAPAQGALPTTFSTSSMGGMNSNQSIEVAVAAAPRLWMSVPLALVNPEVPIPMNPFQQFALRGIQEEFGQAVSGLDDDPSNPAYQQSWLRAQRQADERYRVMFGWTAFNRLSIERRRAELVDRPEEIFVPITAPRP